MDGGRFESWICAQALENQALHLAMLRPLFLSVVTPCIEFSLRKNTLALIPARAVVFDMAEVPVLFPREAKANAYAAMRALETRLLLLKQVLNLGPYPREGEFFLFE